MTSGQEKHPHEIPETPQTHAMDEIIGPETPDSASETGSVYESFSHTTAKKSGKNKRNNKRKKNSNEPSEEQRSDSRGKLLSGQSTKQDEARKKRDQPPRSESLENQTHPKVRRIILHNNNGGEKSEQTMEARSRLGRDALAAVQNLALAIDEKDNEIYKLKNPSSPEISVAQLAEKIENLEKENEALTRRNDDLGQHIRSMTVYSEELHDKINKEHQDYRKVCDDEIQLKWGQLRFIIQNLCISYLTKMPRKKASPNDPEVAASIREKPHLSQYILQQMIWCKISEAIFRGDGDIWGGDMASFLNDWRKAVTEKCMNDPSNGHVYGRIKSETAYKIWKTLGIDKIAKNRFDEALTSELDYFNTKKDSCRDQVSAISTKALEIYTILMKSKAMFIIRSGGLGPSKPPNTPKKEFEYIYLDPAGPGKSGNLLKITPALNKIGNADGFADSYHDQITVCKAQVLVY